MPATAGRVRMPHNNRMATSATLKSSAIWSQTIGHDPHASAADKEEDTSKNSAADAEKVKNVMEMARSQNVTDGSNRDGFTAKMFLGLKRGKQRRGCNQQQMDAVDPNLQRLLEDPSSSSEEEFIDEPEENKKTEKKRSKDSKKHHRKSKSKYSDSSSDDETSSSDIEESYQRERKRRKKKRSKKDRKRRREASSSDDSESDDGRHNSKRKRKEKRRRRDDRKKSSKWH